LIPVNESLSTIHVGTINDIRGFRTANASAVPIAIIGTTPMDSFFTEIDMGQRMAASPMKQPQFGFPFDLVSLSSMINICLLLNRL
jgi:hypothetical protein